MLDENIKVIKISKEDSEKVEAIQFEVQSYKSLLSFMIGAGTDIKSDGFRSYHGEYVLKNTEYELAKEEVASKYLGDWKDRCNWNLDFATNTITAIKVK